MGLTRVELENFTAFRSLKLDLSPGVNVLVGANGTGKDSDGNNLAASQACQAAKERLRRREVGKSISITVLRPT